jgi:UDP-2,3-diacylglucosamine hydrolase
VGRSLFVSDIHISSKEDPKYKLFSEFLDHCATIQLDHLFLVGDIFDLWVADRSYFVENFHGIPERLTRLKGMGVEIHYFEGNHDLDLKLYWQEQLGFDVHENAAYFKLGPLQTRVEHGDQMDPEDKGYLFLRWFLRTPPLKSLGRNLPNQMVKWIGTRASHASRDYTTNVKSATDDQSREKVRKHAAQAYQERPFDLFVSGHLHVREDSQQDHFRCINLGTWLKEPLVLDVSGADIQLRKVADFLKLK